MDLVDDEFSDEEFALELCQYPKVRDRTTWNGASTAAPTPQEPDALLEGLL
eukprot:CAMPEP_0177668752 /NCGR_PEP_ID=MMETSP0447-20121125/22982_1 /TAXON_ID=0 /ORGANISM="Stygamoeba regulata, Strain BSH-02190019" /LENGTH=50 /DNA_ID=CAMNT_0019175387 /DNA_START=178 /DNA_END=327 /DNA_ORIENTATION=+